MGSVDQRIAKLLAFKVGGLRKKSDARPRPYLNQSADSSTPGVELFSKFDG